MSLNNLDKLIIQKFLDQCDDFDYEIAIKSITNLNDWSNDPEEISHYSDEWIRFCNEVKSFFEENKEIPEVLMYYGAISRILCNIEYRPIKSNEISELRKIFQRLME